MNMTTSIESTSLPITKAARILGVHPNTLRAWADTGRVRCLRINDRGDRRFLVEDLHSFMATTQTIAAPAPQSISGSADWEAQIDSIAKLGTRLNRLSTVSDIGNAICLELRQLIDYHNVRVYRVSGDAVLPVAWRGEIGAYTHQDSDQLRLRLGEGITGWVAQHGVAQYLPDAARDPRGSTMPDTESDLAESMLVAPMLYGNRTTGVIVLSKLGLGRFRPDDLRYLGIYASIAAQAMANADIAERLRAQEKTLDQQLQSQRELLRVSESILTNLDPSAVVDEIADSLGALIPVDDLGIYIHERQQHRLNPLLARGAGADDFMSRQVPDSDNVAAGVLVSGDARSVRTSEPDAGAVIVAPLRGHEQVLGVLYLKRSGMNARFEAREFDLVRLFAAHVSIALQNALAHRAVKIRAQMDALTGLKNHGTFKEDLSRIIHGRVEFGLLMLDLDDFKAFNDRRGHEAGNELLKGIAGALRSACRASDEVYRYGGDEFAVILPLTGLEGALEVAEHVRSAVRDVRAPGHRRAGMRCSVGVAAYPADASSSVELLLAADRALYAAKRAGRDRVSTAGEGLAQGVEFLPPPTPVDEPRSA